MSGGGRRGLIVGGRRTGVRRYVCIGYSMIKQSRMNGRMVWVVVWSCFFMFTTRQKQSRSENRVYNSNEEGARKERMKNE